MMPARSGEADYGLDAPGLVRNCLLFGGLGIAVGAVLALALSGIGRATGLLIFAAASVPFAQGALMIWYARSGKYRFRDRMLEGVRWRGDEAVLDVGTGRGLLLIGAAKKVPAGKAVGIDIWSQEDLSENESEGALRNARIEGVADKVEIRNEDCRSMSFPDGTFDVVLSNLCIHNIPTAAGRAKACQEIARVLKPGGTALISDYTSVDEYVSAFREAGCAAKVSPKVNFFPPLRIVTVRR
jgi:arsenite methyltransferase